MTYKTKKKRKQELFKRKSLNDFNKEELDIINIISVSTNRFPVVGSFLFKEHKYPGDIDLCEDILECCEIEEAKEKITERILTTIRKILLHNPRVVLADFKAGVDKRLCDINYDKNTVQKKMAEKIQELSFLKNIDKDELMMYLSKRDYSNFNEKIHNLYVIRWEIADLLKGYKKHNNEIIYLKDAIAHHEIVKLDVWYKLNNRYVEITNFMNICVSDKKEVLCKKYLSKNAVNLKESLKKDIKKYFEGNNYLKCIKRIWSLMNYLYKHKHSHTDVTVIKDIVKKIKPIFRKEPAILSQIYADLEVIRDMLSKLKKVTKQRLFNADEILYMLLNIKNKLKVVIKSKDKIQENNDQHKYIDLLFSIIDKYRNNARNILVKSETYWKQSVKKRFMEELEIKIIDIMDYVFRASKIKSLSLITKAELKSIIDKIEKI